MFFAVQTVTQVNRKGSKELYKVILTIFTLIVSPNMIAAPMIFVFDGDVDIFTRVYDRCIQPCDSPAPINPDLPNYETDIRVETNGKFQASFIINWSAVDPEFNIWDGVMLEGRLQVYDSATRDDRHITKFTGSTDITTVDDHGNSFSTIGLSSASAFGPTAFWDSTSSRGIFDIYADTFVGNWRFQMKDASILDPRIELIDEPVELRNIINGIGIDNFFSISELTPAGLHFFSYELEGMSDVTLTTYFGDELPPLVNSQIPIPSSLWLFLSGIFAVTRKVRYSY